MKLVLAAGAVAIIVVAPFSAAAPSKPAPPCDASRNDVLCVRHALVRIVKRKASPKVKAGTARRVSAGSTIQLTKSGVADLYLARAAQCRDLSLSRAGTRLRTRFPETFLFKQIRGDALCTMADGRIVLVKAGEKVNKAVARAPQKAPFFASIEASDPRGEPTEYRIRFYPRTALVLSTHRGKLLVRMSTGAVTSIPAGDKLTVALGPGGSFLSSATGVATFSPAEEALFGKQLDLPDLAVSIQTVNVSCPSPGSCTTTVTYTLSNLGKVVSPTFDISVRANPGLVATTQAKSIFPGKPVTRRTAVGPGGNCFNPDCTVEVTVDPKDDVLETSEQNNVATKTVPG